VLIFSSQDKLDILNKAYNEITLIIPIYITVKLLSNLLKKVQFIINNTQTSTPTPTQIPTQP
jgi:hypothetical protein